MGVDKQGSKGGGSYVGGFLQLFDWNAKSRKKLFSNKSELPERSKQGKRNDGNVPMTRLNLIDEDATVAGSSIRGSSDYSCASSVTDDEAYVSKAPGVVARLMGLDSLPTSNIAEPYTSPFFDTQSLRDAHYQRKNLESHQNHQISHSGNLLNNVEGPVFDSQSLRDTHYQRKNFEFHQNNQISHSGNLLNNTEGLVRNTSESRPQKMPTRPIEKFQSEILPPKSAKSIPITHHKLLSPIKNPSFIPTKNAAHIMEAAAKIIDTGPQATGKAKRPLVGPSSVPLKVRDLKEKAEAAQKFPMGGSSSVPSRVRDLKERAEAAMKPSKLPETSQRPVESNAAKYLKGQSLNKSWDGPDTTSFRVLPGTGESSADIKNKGKSISLAIQAKVNVQRREGLNSSGSRSLGGQKEQSEVKSSQTFRNQPNSQKSMHKKSPAHNASGVLTQNNQKQNCVVDKNKLPSKPSISVSQGRKQLSGDSSFGRHRTSGKLAGNSKTGSRKMGLDSTGDGQEVLYSSTKNFPRKKRIIDRESHFEKNCGVDFGLADKYEKPNQSNPIIDSHLHWAEDSRKKGTDVVSFTFTAPMTRSMPGSERFNQPQRNNGFYTDYRGKRVLLDSDRTKLSSSLGFNVIGSDALSLLLEQKLREVTIGVGSSGGDSAGSGSATSSASILQHLSPTTIAASNPSNLYDKLNLHGLCTNRLASQFDTGFSSNDALVLRTGHKFKGMDEMDACGSNLLEAKQLFDCRHPSPVSILEPAFSTESCNSSDSNDSNITEGSKQCSSSVQAQEALGLNSLKKFYSVDVDTELSDSASSTSIRTMTRKQAVKFSGTDSMGSRSPKWKLEYVKGMLCNVELMFKDFALGRVTEIINPRLFEQLENRKGRFDSNIGVSQSERKVLFDCVGECLDIRCRRYVGGGCRTWAKGVAMVRRKERLAEEVYKEISGWENMGDSMVDELVDKDMSSQYGKWADFEVEAFELGVEIESRILNSLVNEVVADILRG